MLKRLVKIGISSVVWAMDGLADGICGLFGRQPQRRFVVLYYHGILAGEKEAFERQMGVLAESVIPASCEIQELNGHRRYGAVSFDDAFASVRDHALPILKEKNIPATIFVPTGYLGTRPGWVKKPSLRSRNETIMSAEELRALATEPSISIGSHTVTHPKIAELPEQPAVMELRDSKLALERIIGKAVTLFSFPHGAFTPRDLQLAKQAGYTRVFGIHPALVSESEFMVGRVAVDPLDWEIEFRLKLAGAYRWLAWMSLRSAIGQNGK